MAEPITITELLNEMSRCQQTSGGGSTVPELSQQTGRCVQTIRRDLAKGIAEGLIVCVKEKRPSIDGSARMQPTYRVVAKSKGKK